MRVGVEAKIEGRNHDDGTVRIDPVLTWSTCETSSFKHEDSRIVFSLPDSESDSDQNCIDFERSTSDNDDAFVTAAASFTRRISSVADTEEGVVGIP